jgi:hypothetical protein
MACNRNLTRALRRESSFLASGIRARPAQFYRAYVVGIELRNIGFSLRLDRRLFGVAGHPACLSIAPPVFGPLQSVLMLLRQAPTAGMSVHR